MKNFLSSLLIAALSLPLLGAQHDETIMARRPAASAGITIINGWQGCGAPTSCSMTINAIANDTIFTYAASNGGISASTDSAGNTYTLTQFPSKEFASSYVLHSIGSATTITCNTPGSYTLCESIVLRGVTGLDGTPSFNVTPSSTSYTTSVTTSHGGIILGGVDCQPSVCSSVTAASPWVTPFDAIGGALWASYRTTTTGAAYTFSGTTNVTAWAIGEYAFY